MKKLLPALLALILMMTFACAEEISFGEAFAISLPAEVKTETVEDVVTCVHGAVRTVVQLLPQDVKEDALAQLDHLMKVYDPAMTELSSAALSDSVYLARGVVENSFGEGQHQYVAMVLTKDGLLILSAYHLEGDNQAAADFLTELLTMVQYQGELLLPDEA